MSNNASRGDTSSVRTTLDGTRWEKHRRIVRRILVEGELELLTPTHLGNGDDSVLTDIPLLLDPAAGRALLTGTSLAGALRDYLRSREKGFRSDETRNGLAQLLFGYVRGQDGTQSLLITNDALGAGRPMTELRDGVELSARWRTAEDKKKYDLQLLEAGTTFKLRLELLVVQGKEKVLRRALATALEGLEDQTIRLGLRKHRGFGRCVVRQWSVWDYDLTTAKGLLAWLNSDRSEAVKGSRIADLLQAKTDDLNAGESFKLSASFRLASSLLIRSGGIDPQAPDMVHLHSQRNGEPVPVLSGTSVGGALRARALRIARTVGNDTAAKRFVDDLFGTPLAKKEDDVDAQSVRELQAAASRLWVEETVVQNPLHRVVQRVKIDRFTGGSFPTALFSQQPVFPNGSADDQTTTVEIALAVQNPTEADIGLLLLLLKDLWTEDLPLGGEASVGRGRLAGREVTFERRRVVQPDSAATVQTWRIAADTADGLNVETEGKLLAPADASALLQPYVDQFVAAVNRTGENQ